MQAARRRRGYARARVATMTPAARAAPLLSLLLCLAAVVARGADNASSSDAAAPQLWQLRDDKCQARRRVGARRERACVVRC